MKRRLIILTEIIAPYRIPVFNCLSRNREIDLHVIFLSETDKGQRHWRVYKDEIKFSYEVLPSWRARLGKHAVLLNRGLRRSLERVEPDAILCGGYNYLASWQAANWAKAHEVEFILWLESTAGDERKNSAMLEWMKQSFVRLCDRFVVPGTSSADYLSTFGVGREQIIVAPNAVDNDFYAQHARGARREATAVRQHYQLPEHYFLFAGRFIEAKGVFDLLEAFALLAPEIQAEFGLVFVGNGKAEGQLRRRAARMAPGRVYFPGFRQREELAAFYALADILVFPTHSDPWGLVVNEAMACGLPVICTNVAGCCADLIDDGRNGVVIPSKDVHALAAAMESLALRPDLRKAMGENSLKRIQSFSPFACAQGIAASALNSVAMVEYG